MYDDNHHEIVNIFINVLRKYNLNLNFEKIELEDFPYYAVKNFDRVIEAYRNSKLEDYDLIKLFNDFFEMEKAGTRGAIRYLLKSIQKDSLRYNNEQLFNSYLFTIMANDPRSVTKACSLIIKNNNLAKLNNDQVSLINNMLINNLKKNYDLEVIWLLYVLIETDNIKEDSEIIDPILRSENELAITMVLRKDLNNSFNEISDKYKPWILNYELYAHGYLSLKELEFKLPLKK
ncbi:hypothetical protein [Anaerococcus nagyae]|uniref:Uncharacterized protein n=1 Tax=Anaerococcus nagyae TaxID=1755241 RepID=A0A3E2TM09_9FIRM|nr:hypothetical protein [Anaerococcus nagyae]RGB77950.1 hypothetical protein DXA39_00405 [Anaerococcus nagyae]